MFAGMYPPLQLPMIFVVSIGRSLMYAQHPKHSEQNLKFEPVLRKELHESYHFKLRLVCEYAQHAMEGGY